jgi:general secretion pathway protein H
MAKPVAKVMTPTSVPGSKAPLPAARARGFTLIELLVVVALLAIASAAISLALRDPAAAQLEREAERLAALFESARAEARTAGLAVSWMPVQDSKSEEQFRFVGLPAKLQMPSRWLDAPAPVVEILGNARAIRLGPEPIIGAQSLRLRLGSQAVTLATDGLGAFAPVAQEMAAP